MLFALSFSFCHLTLLSHSPSLPVFLSSFCFILFISEIEESYFIPFLSFLLISVSPLLYFSTYIYSSCNFTSFFLSVCLSVFLNVTFLSSAFLQSLRQLLISILTSRKKYRLALGKPIFFLFIYRYIYLLFLSLLSFFFFFIFSFSSSYVLNSHFFLPFNDNSPSYCCVCPSLSLMLILSYF